MLSLSLSLSHSTLSLTPYYRKPNWNIFLTNAFALRVPPTSFLILYDSIQLTDHKVPRYTFPFSVLLELPLSIASTLVLVPVGWETELVLIVSLKQ